MRVYRYLSEEELNKILSRDTADLGTKGVRRRPLANTFKYNKKERYLHFFKNSEDMRKIKNIRMRHDKKNNKKTKYYFCTFEIHPTVLFFAAGTGFYAEGRIPGEIGVVREYAIKTKHFNPDWLIEYVRDDVKNDEHVVISPVSTKE